MTSLHTQTVAKLHVKSIKDGGREGKEVNENAIYAAIYGRQTRHDSRTN
jgi:hypothetical protein